MNKGIVYAATPEAKARLAGRAGPPGKGAWQCEKMARAQKKAEAVAAELKAERPAVGGDENKETE